VPVLLGAINRTLVFLLTESTKIVAHSEWFKTIRKPRHKAAQGATVL